MLCLMLIQSRIVSRHELPALGCTRRYSWAPCTRGLPWGDNSATSVFRPATSQMLKRVAADAIEFRELYFSMDPRFRDWEHEKTIDQVWQGILSGKTDALEAGDHFRLASIIEVGITVGEVLCEMGWRFIYAPDGHRSSHPKSVRTSRLQGASGIF